MPLGVSLRRCSPYTLKRAVPSLLSQRQYSYAAYQSFVSTTEYIESIPLLKDAELHARLCENERRVVPINTPPLVAEFHTNSYAANSPCEDSHNEVMGTKGLMLGVFDGHGGVGASHFLRDEFLSIVNRLLRDPETERIPTRLQSAFTTADAAFTASRWACDRRRHEVFSGACALMGYVTHDDYVFLANAGDCYGFVGSKTVDNEWIPRGGPQRHTADNPTEKKRLLTQHPHDEDILREGRVKGLLIPTRAFGSATFKSAEINAAAPQPLRPPYSPPYISAEPDVTRIKVQPSRDRFMVLASDGLWDLVNPHTAAKLVGKALESGEHASQNLASLLIKAALSNVSIDWDLRTILSLPMDMRRSFHDDITVSVVLFREDHEDVAYHDPDCARVITADEQEIYVRSKATNTAFEFIP